MTANRSAIDSLRPGAHKSFRVDSDDCATCTHAAVEPQPGCDNVLCREPRVLEAFERERVAASLARGVVCGAEFWRGRR